VLALGDDPEAVWGAATTTDKDRKHLLRTLVEEVNITVERDHTGGRAELICSGRALRSATWLSRQT